MNTRTVNAGMARQAGELPNSGIWLRVVSALVLAPIALGAIWGGTPYFEIFVAVAATIMAWEWGEMHGHSRITAVKATLIFGVLAVTILGAIAQYLPLLIVLLLCILLVSLLSGSGKRRWAGSGLLYIGIPCLSLVWLRGHPSHGFEFILGLFVVVWATDIGAYFSGRAIGGPKLAPQISPNKTWAGFFGGLFCAMVGALAVVKATALANTEFAIVLMIAVGLSVGSQMGDLLESWIKRRQAVKDTGTLIPGHGGVLDRVDGLLVAAPLSAILLLAYQSWWS